LAHRRRVDGSKRDHYVGKPGVDRTGGVLEALVLAGRGHAEPTEHLDRAAVGGRDQVAAQHQCEQQRIEAPVDDAGRRTLEGCQIGVVRSDVRKAPTEPQRKSDEKQNADAFVKVRS